MIHLIVGCFTSFLAVAFLYVGITQLQSKKKQSGEAWMAIIIGVLILASAILNLKGNS